MTREEIVSNIICNNIKGLDQLVFNKNYSEQIKEVFGWSDNYFDKHIVEFLHSLINEFNTLPVKKNLTGQLIQVKYVVAWSDEIQWCMYYNKLNALLSKANGVFNTLDEAEAYAKDTLLEVKRITISFKFI